MEDKKFYVREYEVLYGKHKGVYKIYFNRHWLLLDHPDAKIVKWNDPEMLNAKPGDWFEGTDGGCCQLLDLKIVEPKWRYKDYWTYVYTFCHTILKQLVRKKDMHFPKHYFNVLISPVNRSRYTSFREEYYVQSRYKIDVIRKLKFIYRTCILGEDITKAYEDIYKRKRKKYQIYAYAIKAYLETINKGLEMKEEFIAKLKQYFTDEKLMEEMIMLIERSRKGSDAHRQNLQFLLELLGYKENKKDKLIKAKDAEFEELKPPLLED